MCICIFLLYSSIFVYIGIPFRHQDKIKTMQDGHPNQKIKVPISPQTGSLDTNPACVPDRFKRGDTMGRKIPQLLVVAYANAFAEEPRLKEVSEMRSFVFPRVPQTTELSPKPQKCGLALVSVGVFKTAPRWGSASFWMPPETCLSPRRSSPSETWRPTRKRLPQSCVCPEEWAALAGSFCSMRCCGFTRSTSYSLLDFARRWSA